MLTVSPDFLRLTDEAVLLIRRGKIIFANDAGKILFGSDCVEKPASAVIGHSIAASQSLTFSASVDVDGKEYVVRSSVSGDVQALFFSRPDCSGVMMTDAMICSLRGSMMTMNISVANLRDAAEALQDDELENTVASISEQGHKISRLIANASVAKSVSEGNLPFAPAPHDIAQMCSDIADSISILRNDFDVSYSGPAHLTINCDRALTELMIFNLISNSLIHAAGATRIRLSLSSSGERVFFTVSDNGCGMDGNALCSVFSRFKREMDLSSLGQGAGFGMTVVRGVAAAHGGTVLLESSPQRGTVVRVSFSSAIEACGNVSAPDNVPQGMEQILTCLAGCIPTDCYSAKYND